MKYHWYVSPTLFDTVFNIQSNGNVNLNKLSEGLTCQRCLSSDWVMERTGWFLFSWINALVLMMKNSVLRTLEAWKVLHHYVKLIYWVIQPRPWKKALWHERLCLAVWALQLSSPIKCFCHKTQFFYKFKQAKKEILMTCSIKTQYNWSIAWLAKETRQINSAVLIPCKAIEVSGLRRM